LIDFERLIAEYKAIEPVYKRLADILEQMLKLEARRAGVRCVVTARAKDPGSYLKKVVRKGYHDPLTEMKDKAGARVIVDHLGDSETMRSALDKLLVVEETVESHERLKPNELGYLGTNVVGHVRQELLGESDAELRVLPCEVQIHTRAQNLWSDMAHAFLYKPPVEIPYEVQRTLYGLQKNVEDFDEHLKGSIDVIYSRSGFQEATMLRELDKLYYRYSEKPYDDALSFLILASLRNAYTAEELPALHFLLEDFTARYDEKLRTLYSVYEQDDRCTPFLFQPEALLVFERLESDPDRLTDVWTEVLPEPILDQLRDVWGGMI
jgi:ppGpp synthetase/RelA/SpoT-type nucleotidyltranferase